MRHRRRSVRDHHSSRPRRHVCPQRTRTIRGQLDCQDQGRPGGQYTALPWTQSRPL
ncbi:MAG TPA: hypothetical protein DCY79_07035 [Planctomycetaceae bacterium]|nr:hypothetical protein [Planctomycetaceae bacterium]